MAKNQQKVGNYSGLIGLFTRYMALLILALIFSFSTVFYDFFLKLTIYPSSYLINFLYPAAVSGSNILVNSYIIEIIPACVAVSAYFLFFILNLSTSMNLKTRLKSLLFLFVSLLVINIFRIFIFSMLLLNNFIYFEAVHKFTWYSMNILIVVGLWFLAVRLFNIRNIPIYSDFRLLIENLKRR
jgi:exosortase/archaeosortase family protein